MRSRFKLSLSDMLRQHRRWERTLAKAVKVTRKALVSASSMPATAPVPVRPRSAGKLEEVKAFGSNPGHLRMLRYVPADLPKKSPLVVVLHGCHQTAEAYDQGSGWSTLARERGFAVVYAEQKRSNNPNLCFNWFRPSNVARDRGEVMSIRQMVAKMATAHGIDRKRVFVTGLSAGGAMTAAMLAAYPDIFRGGGIIAGLPYGAARDVQRALAAMKNAPERSREEWGELVRAASPVKRDFPSVSIWHGTRDHTVSLSNADALLGQWLDVHGLDPHAFVESEVDGHVRRAWKDKTGKVAVELYLIEGMGHGTPLKPRPASRTKADTPGPYMLDAGISSSMHLATAWGLKKPALFSALRQAAE
ncbi:PHB depolymerase family esterase [Pararhizobium sp. BT-229]|uniref:extracellular catalytic domain type 1 short-chain-length polyhydroxyalkanoate depolymerase n=1 Tax=Pararhizobium sp. BT-229 TaxID=2986923 RepID=UPI0021F7E2D1|nr:PHB depolymerase family esterase [Pararhizobium sp. BT-229]MCV9963087.1 PHB depolymerase family esterase [Pararhizobium sp. BT-229]